MSKTPEKLSFIQAVRKRPAMYIGSTSIRGVHFLLRKFVRYALTLAKSDSFTFEIVDSKSGRMSFVMVEGPMNEDRFSNPDLDDWSGRSVDYELAAFNALCSSFRVEQMNLLTQTSRESRFAMGFEAHASTNDLVPGPTKVVIDFKLDESIFSPNDGFDWNVLLEVFRTLAYLYAGTTLRLIYTVNGNAGDAVFRYDGGLADLIELQRLDEHAEPVFAFAVEHDFGDFSFDGAIHFRGNSWVDPPHVISFVNEERSTGDGTHVDGVLKGLLAALVHFQSDSTGTSDRILTIDGLKRLLVAAVHLRMERPMFEGAIKRKVISRNIIGPISNFVGEVFLARLRAEPEQADDLVKVIARLSSS